LRSQHRNDRKASGRKEDFLWFALPNGERECLHPSQMDEFYLPGLIKYQFEQTSPDRLLMRMKVSESAE
jgi:hypothetical protein